MFHRIREAGGRGEFRLHTLVEVTETYMGGLENNKQASMKLNQRRDTVGKTPVGGVREWSGQVKAKPLTHTDTATLVGFVEGHITPATFVYTDVAAAYAALPDTFTHESVNHGEGVRGEIHTNSIESVWAVLKRAIHGTWHQVSPKHLSRYVNEATFRLNEGNCRVATLNGLSTNAVRLPQAATPLLVGRQVVPHMAAGPGDGGRQDAGGRISRMEAQAHRAEQAEAGLLEAAHRKAVAALASASVAEAGEIPDNKIDQWLERKRSEDGCES